MSDLFNSKAFGQSVGAWFAKANQQIRDIYEKLEENKAVRIEMDQELREVSNKISLAVVQLTNLETRIKTIEENQSKVVWAILGIFIAALGGVILNFSKIEHQLQNPSVPRSESPAKPSSKL